MNSTRALFLASCRVVADALDDSAVAVAWDEPSVLNEQSIGGLAAHLAGGSWLPLDYLAADPPDGPATLDCAADYFATLLNLATEEMHAGIRERGAQGAAAGGTAIAAAMRGKAAELELALDTEPKDRLLSVYGGFVMTLDAFLETRLVEQVVHLDDLARSIGRDPWANAPGADDLVISIGIDIGRRRYGDTATLRALFRGVESGSPFADGVTA